jgi:ADP-ribose pyrophosphatase YjhB (NUDIX family)
VIIWYIFDIYRLLEGGNELAKDVKAIVAVGPVIIEDDKVLLSMEGEDAFWKFPGGKIEVDDLQVKSGPSILQNVCAREAEEEIGAEIEILRQLDTLLLPRPNHPDEAVVLIHFLAKLNGKVESKEGIECRWFSINCLPENIAPNVIPIVQQARGQIY